jgi:PII-like signaling protein
MKLEGEQVLLRVHLRSTDKYGWWRTAVDALVESARERGLAGATVLRGIYGLDITGRLIAPSVWSLAETVPVVVEIVDAAATVGLFLESVAEIVTDGMATLERGHVLLYRAERAVAARLTVPAPVADLSTLPSPAEFPAMHLAEDGQLLRVFVGESDTWEGQPLYRAVVHKAKELGLAGATVLRGAMGFGANSRVHTSKIMELSTDLPILIEIVDAADKVQTLLPFLDEVVKEGMITIEAVKVLRYRHDPAKARVQGGS